MQRINDVNDLERISPEEHPNHKGFYYFPDNKNLAVNKIGQVLNTKSNNIIKCQLHKNGRFQVVINTILENGEYRALAYKHHRIVARVFVGRPNRHINVPFSKLEVNHIDGNYQNNHPSNLEWCTGKENSHHCHINNLHSKDIMVLSKNLLTGEIKRFNSVDRCAAYYKIIKPTFHKHLKSKLVGKGHKLNCIFKYDDGTPWKHYSPDQMFQIGRGNDSLAVKLLVLKTNEVKIFKTIKEAANFSGICYSKLYRELNKNDKYISRNYKYIRLI